jgi:hypothetical protein
MFGLKESAWQARAATGQEEVNDRAANVIKALRLST